MVDGIIVRHGKGWGSEPYDVYRIQARAQGRSVKDVAKEMRCPASGKTHDEATNIGMALREKMEKGL